MKKYQLIKEVLTKWPGSFVHTFRSGGGLRVSRIDIPKGMPLTPNGKDVFYGEHPYYEDSLELLEKDIKAGGQNYKDVYGPIETHYLTGAYPKAENTPDAFICAGGDIDISLKEGLFKVNMKISKERKTPEEISKWVLDGSQPILWENEDKITYLTYMRDDGFCVTKTMTKEKNISWFKKVNFIGIDKNLEKAFDKAIDESLKGEDNFKLLFIGKSNWALLLEDIVKETV